MTLRISLGPESIAIQVAHHPSEAVDIARSVEGEITKRRATGTLSQEIGSRVCLASSTALERPRCDRRRDKARRKIRTTSNRFKLCFCYAEVPHHVIRRTRR